MTKALVLIVALSTFAGVVGCAPKIVAKNEQSISLKYKNISEKRAFAVAQKHCASFGKSAVPTIMKSPTNKIATFECR